MGNRQSITRIALIYFLNVYIYSMFQRYLIYAGFAAMFFYTPVHAQSVKTDSIFRLMKQAGADTIRVKLLIDLSAQFNREAVYDSALKYAEDALLLSKRIGYNKGIVRCLIRLGVTYFNKGDHTNALSSYMNAANVCSELGDRTGLASCYNNMGNVYKKQGQFDLALEHMFKSIKIREEISDSIGLAAGYTNVGVLYRVMGKYDEAVKYNLLALEIDKRMGSKRDIAMDYGNLANIYRDLGNYKLALENLFNSLAVFEELNDPVGIMKVNLNIGEISQKKGEYETALGYYLKALTLARAAGAKDIIYNSYNNISEAYAGMNNMGEAYRYQRMARDMSDSIINEERAREIAELQVTFDTREKEKEIQLLTKDKLLDAERIKQQRIINYAVVAGLLLALLLVFFIYRGYRDKQKANAELSEKNAIIGQKNQDITDSINYAQRIQSSILPSGHLIEKLCPGSFVLYMPKDIVSGDFYYFCSKGDYIYIVAADCTGHGVPGALMSMIGLNQLHEIIEVRGITQTAEILEELHKRVLLMLNADISQRDSKDGMDVALLRIDRKNNCAQFAGAVRPLYRVDASGLSVYKGDRYSIAGVKEVGGTPFTTHEMPAASGTMFYLFSDGYADQFGESTRKKFMVKRLQELLISIHSLPGDVQREKLRQSFGNWKGACEQVDDVLVIGVRL